MLQTISTIILVLLISIYLFFKWKFNYWKNLGIPFIKPTIPFGNIQGFKKNIHSAFQFKQYYEEFKRTSRYGFGGIYFFVTPVVIPTDLSLLKSIFVKDFQHFHDRRIYYNEKDDPVSAHLSALDGAKWELLRSKISPTFTSGKIKMMFSNVVEIANRLEKVLSKLIETDKKVNIKALMTRYTTDIIGSCAIGIDCNALENPDSEFIKVFSQKLSRSSFIMRLLTVSAPKIAKFLRLKSLNDNVSNFFMKVTAEVVKYREENGVHRNDFMDLLIQLKNTGCVKDDSGKEEKVGSITIAEIAAQCFVFFLGGYETSSATLNFCLYELSLNSEFQEKARKNIQEVLKKYNGMLSYESLSEMTYLNMCINETLRKYPIFSNITREVTMDFKVPNSKIVLEKGTMIIIPIYAFHHDPQYFPEPDKFDPERFSSAEIEKRNKFCFTPYFPFGEGKHICIGMRFGILETKMGLAKLLMNFKFKLENTTDPLKFNKKSMTLTPEKDILLHVEKCMN